MSVPDRQTDRQDRKIKEEGKGKMFTQLAQFLKAQSAQRREGHFWAGLHVGNSHSDHEPLRIYCVAFEALSVHQRQGKVMTEMIRKGTHRFCVSDFLHWTARDERGRIPVCTRVAGQVARLSTASPPWLAAVQLYLMIFYSLLRTEHIPLSRVQWECIARGIAISCSEAHASSTARDGGFGTSPELAALLRARWGDPPLAAPPNLAELPVSMDLAC